VPRVPWRSASESPTPSRSRAGHRSRRSATRRAGEAGRAGTYRPSMVRSPVQRSTALSPSHRSAATDRGGRGQRCRRVFWWRDRARTPPSSAMRPRSCANCARSSSSGSHRSASQHSSPRTRGNVIALATHAVRVRRHRSPGDASVRCGNTVPGRPTDPEWRSRCLDRVPRRAGPTGSVLRRALGLRSVSYAPRSLRRGSCTARVSSSGPLGFVRHMLGRG
jgi:hypothetical protein